MVFAHLRQGSVPLVPPCQGSVQNDHPGQGSAQKDHPGQGSGQFGPPSLGHRSAIFTPPQVETSRFPMLTGQWPSLFPPWEQHPPDLYREERREKTLAIKTGIESVFETEMPIGSWARDTQLLLRQSVAHMVHLDNEVDRAWQQSWLHAREYYDRFYKLYLCDLKAMRAEMKELERAAAVRTPKMFRKELATFEATLASMQRENKNLEEEIDREMARLKEQVNMLYDGLADDTTAEDNDEWAAMARHCTCGALHR